MKATEILPNQLYIIKKCFSIVMVLKRNDASGFWELFKTSNGREYVSSEPIDCGSFRHDVFERNGIKTN